MNNGGPESDGPESDGLEHGGHGSPVELAVTSGGAVLRRLAQLGVDLVLVNSGTDFPPIVEGLAEAEAHGHDLPRVLTISHEHVAMGMAHGHYIASGRAPALILHTNVGLANSATAAINAADDRVPLILMSGRTPTVEQDRFGARTVPIGWGQEMRDQAALVREACKWDYELRFPEQVPKLLDRAYAIANSTPKGPVYLSLPREVLSEPCPADELQSPPAMAASEVAAPPDAITDAAALLAGAKRPAIFAQRGCGTSSGFDALARLANRWSIPVCQYWALATAVSSGHPMNLGDDPEPWVSQADVILVVDSLAPWSPDIHRLAPGCQVIHLGPDPLFSRIPVRNFQSDLSITTEVATGLIALESAMDTTNTTTRIAEATLLDRRSTVRAHRETRMQRLDAQADHISGSAMSKAYVSRCVARAVKGHHATIVSELGCILDHLDLSEHDSWRRAPHSGGLGWGLPAAMGIKLADPERLVVATMGDGSYIFANPVACHHAAEANNIAVLTLILNNSGYGVVAGSVLGQYPSGYAAKADKVPLTDLSPIPDFTMVAKASRAYAESVVDGDELPAALERAVQVVTVEQRQAVLDITISG